jgi:hypothetical protein
MKGMKGRGGRVGLSPVLVYEAITFTRRWEGYAARSLFVLFLLYALVAVWWSARLPAQFSIRAMAQMGSVGDHGDRDRGLVCGRSSRVDARRFRSQAWPNFRRHDQAVSAAGEDASLERGQSVARCSPGRDDAGSFSAAGVRRVPIHNWHVPGGRECGVDSRLASDLLRQALSMSSPCSGVWILASAIGWGKTDRSQPFVWAIVWTIAFSIAAAGLILLARAGRSRTFRKVKLVEIDRADESIADRHQSANALAGGRVPGQGKSGRHTLDSPTGCRRQLARISGRNERLVRDRRQFCPASER